MTAAGLKDLFDRTVRAMERRAGFGRATGQAHACLDAADGFGLALDVEMGDRTVRVDLPAAEGGEGTGPHPGELMRASLASCLVIGYRLWAARLGIPLSGASADIVAEYDARGQLGVAPGVPAGWQRLLIDVTIASSAPEADVRRLVETADRLSPMLANLSPAIERVHHLTVVPQPTS